MLTSLLCILWTISLCIHNWPRRVQGGHSYPVLWKKKLRHKIAKWFSKTTWLVNWKPKTKLTSCLFLLHPGSPSERSFTLLRAVQAFLLFLSILPILLKYGKDTPTTTFIHKTMLSKSHRNQWALPPHATSIHLHSCSGSDLGGYMCPIWNLKQSQKQEGIQMNMLPVCINVIWAPWTWPLRLSWIVCFV